MLTDNDYQATYDLTDKLQEALERKLDDGVMSKIKKQIGDAMNEAQAALEDAVRKDLTANMAHTVQRMFELAIEAMFDGDDNRMRHYLSCRDGYFNGRDKTAGLIHGTLFESTAEKIRRKIVEAHADLLVSERIKDLEAQLAKVTQQANEYKAQHERAWQGY